MTAPGDPYTAQLDALARKGRRRALAPIAGHDFTSNDYLGLAASPLLGRAVEDALARGVPHGSGGSRLLRGNHPEHVALEEEAAAWAGSEAALFFATGFAANMALFATLPQRGDLVIHDAYIHASVHEGMRLGRAEYVAARHNDTDAFADAAAHWRKKGGTGRIWIAAESLYSMDGDRAPLAELDSLARALEAMLVIDEAHAAGVFGDKGAGLAGALTGEDHVVTLRTCGKALGAEGGLLFVPRTLRDFLVNRARGFIFSTAPSPLSAALVRAAIRLVADRPDLREELHGLIAHAEGRFGDLCPPAAKGSQIFPVLLGADEAAMEAASALQAAGFDVRGIRPPTVPEGTARLRIAVTRNIGAAEIDALADALADLPAASRAA